MDISAEKLDSEYMFIDNKRDEKRLLYVLAGYKPILWDIVFERIKLFCPTNVDVCIVSSGIFSERLEEICETNKWSYVSTSVNKLTIAQNIVMTIFDQAELIFKMDEDIFVTYGFWEELEKTYTEYEKKYRIGFVGPLLPLHNYGFNRYLEMKGIEKEWKEFAPYFSNQIMGGHGKCENPVLYSDEIADFLWDSCPQIDEEANSFRNSKRAIEFVNSRFPICAILFKRNLWRKIGGFDVGEGNGGGSDEVKIIQFCAINSYYILCNPRVICYHFGFFFQEHILYRKFSLFNEKFRLSEKYRLIQESEFEMNTGKIMGEDIMPKYDKYYMLYKMCKKWIKNSIENKGISKKLEENGVANIAIYGWGELAWLLSMELSSINIQYIIDRNAEGLGVNYPVFTPHDVLPSVDLIIVTIVDQYEEIKNTLTENNNEIRICSLDELICEDLWRQ